MLLCIFSAPSTSGQANQSPRSRCRVYSVIPGKYDSHHAKKACKKKGKQLAMFKTLEDRRAMVQVWGEALRLEIRKKLKLCNGM